MNCEPSLEAILSDGCGEGSRVSHCSFRATAWLRFGTAGAARLLPLLLLLALPTAVQAQDYHYAMHNGTITITLYTGAGGVVTIPSTINGLPVTSIGQYAFFDRTSLTSVTIPNSVTRIGYEAFSGCSSLTAITVDASNPGYSSLAGVLFNKSQTTLIRYPAGKAGSYTIPSRVTKIGYSAFSGCSSLTSVMIPNSVTSIGVSAFGYCTGLTNVTIGNSVTKIGDYAFVYCTWLTSVTIPNSVTKIGDYAFSRCTGLTSVTKIGDYAFGYCTSLTGVHFQGNAPRIGFGVFDNAVDAIVYYLPGTKGWGPSFGGRPTTKAARLTMKVNFRPGKLDSAKLEAVIELPGGISLNNVAAQLSVGNVTVPFTLGGTGVGRNGYSSLKLKRTEEPISSNQLWQVSAKLKGDWDAEWANDGLLNATTNMTITVPVLLLLDSNPPESLFSEKSLFYKATAGKSGTAK